VTLTSSLWSVHWSLWQETFSALWEKRHPLVVLTVLLWVPWRIAVPFFDHVLGFRAFAGFPLEWIADALYEPLYGGIVLVFLAEEEVLPLPKAMLRGLWLLPRLWLIDFKIAVWGLAAPYLVLHIGSAVVLAWCANAAVARGMIVATFLSLAWMVVVIVRYVLASAVIVAERQAEGWTLSHPRPLKAVSLWVGSGGVSTGWSLWAARQLVRGRALQAVLVILIGQVAVSLLMALVPPGDNILMQAVSGVSMVATTLWWGLLWQFCLYCVNECAASSEHDVLPAHAG